MREKYSTGFALTALAGVMVAVVLGLSGCTTVESTAIYYLPYSTKVYPPKAKDAPIPILGKAPKRAHTVIGRLAFSTDMGWKFLRESMLYNARMNGADAVVLRDARSRTEWGLMQVPPRMDWVPGPGPAYRNKKGDVYYTTQWYPYFRPGYTMPVQETITGIDAEMIVFK